MKLKVLPPTLRKNHHYLILDVKSEMEISIEEMLSYSWDIFNYKTVLRCGRSYEDDVRVALSTLTRQNKKRIAINTVGVSGTIKSGISKYIED